MGTHSWGGCNLDLINPILTSYGGHVEENHLVTISKIGDSNILGWGSTLWNSQTELVHLVPKSS